MLAKQALPPQLGSAMAQHGVTWHGVTRYSVTQHGMAWWHGAAWHSTVWHGQEHHLRAALGKAMCGEPCGGALPQRRPSVVVNLLMLGLNTGSFKIGGDTQVSHSL